MSLHISQLRYHATLYTYTCMLIILSNVKSILNKLYYLLRTLQRTLAAALTFLIVNHRDISVHGDCTERTFLRAEGTADAACLAGIHYRLALFR